MQNRSILVVGIALGVLGAIVLAGSIGSVGATDMLSTEDDDEWNEEYGPHHAGDGPHHDGDGPHHADERHGPHGPHHAAERQHGHHHADAPFDGVNETAAGPTDDIVCGFSPWVTDDERLDQFQDRFNLTDEQAETLQTVVQEQIDEGASPDEIHETVTEHLEAFGVEEPTLGPDADRERGGMGSDRGR